jgi:hypothetical protein
LLNGWKVSEPLLAVLDWQQGIRVIKKKIIFILLFLLIFTGILVGIPLLMGKKHPRPHPESAVWNNLKILRSLEEEYYALKGRYAPDPDGTVYYKEGNTGIQNLLPHFKPGPPKDLSFEYELTSSAKGTKFVAIATGKIGSKVAEEKYYINEKNEKNW